MREETISTLRTIWRIEHPTEEDIQYAIEHAHSYAKLQRRFNHIRNKKYGTATKRDSIS